MRLGGYVYGEQNLCMNLREFVREFARVGRLEQCGTSANLNSWGEQNQVSGAFSLPSACTFWCSHLAIISQ